jgi:hypothetical protein
MTEDLENQIKEKTDNQLSEIYLNANNYLPEFIELVELELVKRKIPLASLSFIRKNKEEISDENLAIGKQGNQVWIVAAFLMSLFGGLGGIIAGYQYAYSKHRNAKGIEYYFYNESTRKYGRWMLIIGCSVSGLILLKIILNA